jgi:hypothetical protein
MYFGGIFSCRTLLYFIGSLGNNGRINSADLNILLIQLRIYGKGTSRFISDCSCLVASMLPSLGIF